MRDRPERRFSYVVPLSSIRTTSAHAEPCFLELAERGGESGRSGGPSAHPVIRHATVGHSFTTPSSLRCMIQEVCRRTGNERQREAERP